MPTTNDTRTAFLDYFARHDHAIVPSSPLVPRNDPSLLFTNAGMVQFKNVLTGLETRPYARAATAQKCVRAGGKHNDLENVGYTARHHTFFEMLGNFSFGDYFKELAIELAWNLITREFGLARDRLLATVYAADDEAATLWAKIAGLPKSRIIPIATADNFWAMGDLGPCGPCSEIFYDHGPSVPGGPPGTAEAEGDRFVEIWNLVFMQYDQVAADKRVPLPRPSIDTGMGLERIAAVLQGRHDNYDIDLFRALIMASAEISGVAPDGEHAISHRVIADHLRASAFLVADGVLPSKDGRGYVLRRIMRRAMRHAHMLGCKEPMMWRLVPALVQQMGSAYPELLRAEPLIAETLQFEESNFKQNLERGLRLLEEMLRGPGLTRDGRLAGAVAFELYDTYGFPIDLTQDYCRTRKPPIEVDLAGFDAEMQIARERSRASWVGSGEAATEAVWLGLREELGATEFLGYETESAAGVVGAIVARRPAGRRGPSRRRGRRRRQPDPVLCRVGGSRGRYRHHVFGVRRRIRGARHGQEGGRPARPSRSGEPRHSARGRCRRIAGRRRAAPAVARQPFRDPPLASGAARSPRRARDAKGVAGSAGPPQVRFQPPAAIGRGRYSGGRGRGQRADPRQRRAAHAPA